MVKTPGLWWRFLTASTVIIVAVATAVSLSALLRSTAIASDLNPIPHAERFIDQIEPGEPQTILIVGSDKRADTPGDPGRSDTTMLLRVDPDNEVLSLFSLPRDLKVDIAGATTATAKLNEAFTDGGVTKTLETVKNLTGLEINHVVNVDFQGFAEGRQRDRLRLRRRRPRLLQRQLARGELAGHVRGDQRQRRLPASLRAERARLRPLPPHRHRHRPRRPPAGLPPQRPLAGPGQRGPADHRRRQGQRADRHLHQVHGLRHQGLGADDRRAEDVHRRPRRADQPGQLRRRRSATSLRDRLARADQEGRRRVPQRQGHAGPDRGRGRGRRQERQGQVEGQEGEGQEPERRRQRDPDVGGPRRRHRNRQVRRLRPDLRPPPQVPRLRPDRGRPRLLLQTAARGSTTSRTRTTRSIRPTSW